MMKLYNKTNRQLSVKISPPLDNDPSNTISKKLSPHNEYDIDCQLNVSVLDIEELDKKVIVPCDTPVVIDEDNIMFGDHLAIDLNNDKSKQREYYSETNYSNYSDNDIMTLIYYIVGISVLLATLYVFMRRK